MIERLRSRRGAAEAAGVVSLVLILGLQLALSVRRESQTWDEGDHIFAGYASWMRADFGLNPEHPPLLKLLATAPLLTAPLRVPELQNRYFKEEAFLDGKEFLYRNDADAILFRTRMAAATLTLLAALLVFAAAREMFGTGAAFVAQALLAFEPNLLAHGALVTTDAGISCFMFATVYAFYRYAKAPSAWRLLLVGVAAGLALAVKHSGIFVFPVLFLLAACEVFRRRITVGNSDADAEAATGTGRRALRYAASLVAVAAIALAVLWAFYGFRYQARPEGLQLNPPLAEYVGGLKPHEAWGISTLARWHALPESYLYGMADVRLTADFYTSYVLEKTYAHGVWFYFPVVFVIKSTLAFLVLLLLAAAAVLTRRLNCWREVLFLTVPPVFYFLVAMSAATNIGVRHILPLYVFLSALAGGAAWAFVRWNRRWAYAVAALLLLHAASSGTAFPHYIAYSNELWGGPSNTYRYLSDSNADWGEQLKETKKYLDARGVKDCWFVYFAEGVAEPAYYGIPCKPLPTINTLWVNQRIEVPASIDGPVLVSASNLSGFEFGPGPLNPYEQFKRLRPTTVVGRGVFVFDGHFDLPLASALGRVQKAQNLLAEGQAGQALSEAQAAVALAPEAVQTRLMLGDALAASGRPTEARAEYERALSLAKSIEPEFQVRSVPDIERKLSGK
ncbi:MAG: phospholipid carrier-dependent glycosyltransferase [Pyrinomonadaceae bacterium]